MNDLQIDKSSLLLQWINAQRSITCNSFMIYSFDQLKSTNFIYLLLNKISPKHFNELNHLQFHLQTYFTQIELYLKEVEGKKIRRMYKKQILEHGQIGEILKVVLFLIIQTQHKAQYISRIFEMNVEVQSYLMEQLQKVSSNLENGVEVKQILETVEKLEEENDVLKDKLREYEQINSKLAQVLKESKQQNKKIEKQVQRYDKQKKIILQGLQIYDLKEFMEIYRSIKNQNQQLVSYANQMDLKRQEIEDENKQMLQKINEDHSMINRLQEQINNVKDKYYQAKSQIANLSFMSRDVLDDTALRQNKNINNTKMRQSVETSCSVRHSFILNFDEECSSDQSDLLKKYNSDLMNKLEQAYKQVSELTEEVSVLKDEKRKLEKKNVFLERKIGDIKKQQQRFMSDLRKIGF